MNDGTAPLHEALLVRAATLGACLSAITLVACAPLAPAPARSPPHAVAGEGNPVSQPPAAPTAPSAASSGASSVPSSTGAPARDATPAPTRGPTSTPTPKQASAPTAASTPRREAVVHGTLPKSAPPAASAAPVGRPPPSPSPAADLAPPAAVPNLSVLEQRLRDTRAIGLFTKLSLKNQVDDLLGRFRALYSGPAKAPTADLRQRYDLLLIKVVGLLQDGDPPLSSAIWSSKEALWSILSDPAKFAHIQL